MTLNRPFIFAILLIISACSKTSKFSISVFPYVFDDSKIDIEGDTTNLIENGKYIFNIDGKYQIEGEYRNGQKLGVWKYELARFDLTLDWSIYNENNERFSLSFPSIWELNEDADADIFFEIDKANPNLRFVIYEHELDEDLELELYLSDYLLELQNNNKVLSRDVFKITERDREFYFIRTKVGSSKRDYYFYGFLHKTRDKLYDMTYISDDSFPEKDEIIFFDFLYGTFINGTRLLSPFDNYIVSPINVRENLKS